MVTNGSHDKRMVGIPDPMQVMAGQVHGFHNKVFIETNKNARSISVTNGPTFDLVVGVDNVVRLSHQGKELSPTEAAQLILDPILFPEL